MLTSARNLNFRDYLLSCIHIRFINFILALYLTGTTPTTIFSDFFLHSSIRRFKMLKRSKIFSHTTKYLIFDNPFKNLRKFVQYIFEILFLLVNITDVVLSFSGKTFCVILLLMAFVSNRIKKSTESIMSLGSIVIMSIAFFISKFLRRFLVTVSQNFLKENLSLRNIVSIDYLFNFYNGRVIFASIDNISSRLYVCVFQNFRQRCLI